ncbi:transposase-like protein [Bradyrhizobium elkanii]|nr:transposase-like protein [Bradyrhizobium elkanii]
MRSTPPALGLSPHSLRIWRDRLEDSGEEIAWRLLRHPSARAQLSSAANCARPKHRLTPEAVDGRSNRRRFSNKPKRAIVQQTEKPGVTVAQVCRSHGVATSMVFRWRVEFGLTARKAPQLATVTLADGAANEVPARAALRDLVQPPDGMMALEPADGAVRPFTGRQHSGCGDAVLAAGCAPIFARADCGRPSKRRGSGTTAQTRASDGGQACRRARTLPG